MCKAERQEICNVHCQTALTRAFCLIGQVLMRFIWEVVERIGRDGDLPVMRRGKEELPMALMPEAAVGYPLPSAIRRFRRCSYSSLPSFPLHMHPRILSCICVASSNSHCSSIPAILNGKRYKWPLEDTESVGKCPAECSREDPATVLTTR